MAKPEKPSKTKAVHDYVKAHPGVSNVDVAAALSKQGVKLTPQHVANIKSKLKKLRAERKQGKATAAAAAAPAALSVAASPVAEQPTKAANTITLDQVKKVAQTVKAIGGFDRLKELLDVVREVGGLKKFRDLLDAMALGGP